MNTRQKLTLGIAAIFMVTLTVIGVTYAYFVTRINYDQTATAEIVTATIGSAYEDDKQTVVITNAIPGQVVYKAFTVNNYSAVDVPFFITLTSKLNQKQLTAASCSVGEGAHTTKEACEGASGTWTPATYENLPAFVHADDTFVEGYDLTSTCYVSAAYEGGTVADTTLPATHCYDGNSYDNILVELYKIDGYGSGKDAFLKIAFNGEDISSDDSPYKGYTAVDFETWTGVTKTVITTTDGTAEKREAPFNNSYTSAIVPVTDSNYATKTLYLNKIVSGAYQTESVPFVPEGSAEGTYMTNYYVLKVTYQNVNKNQNIENNASVSLRLDITSTSVTID